MKRCVGACLVGDLKVLARQIADNLIVAVERDNIESYTSIGCGDVVR
jgi:hypothetical protein